MAIQENWQRSYKIVFGVPEYIRDLYSIDKVSLGPLKKEFQGFDAQSIPSNAVSMSNLTEDGNSTRGFTFALDSTRKAAASSNKKTEKSVLQLYNLNKEAIDVLNQDGCVMRIFAGYQGKVDLIYSGDVEQVSPVQMGQDLIHRVRLTDGGVSEKDTVISVQYDEFTSTSEIITDLVGLYPDSAVGYLGLDKQSTEFTTGGQSYAGKLVKIIDRIMNKNNLRQGRYNGKIVVIPDNLKVGEKDYEKNKINTYLFFPDNVKAISAASTNKNKTTGTEQTQTSINISTFLIPVELGQYFTVPNAVSEEYNGTYLVTEIRQVLRSHGDEWDTILKGEAIK